MSDKVVGTFEIKTVTFQKAETGFAIVKAITDDTQVENACIPAFARRKRGPVQTPVTIKGNLGKVKPGTLIDITGVVEVHPKFGSQISVHTAVRTVRTDKRAVYSFLQGLPHIGPERAQAIVDAFEDPLDILKTDDTKLLSIKGLTEERVLSIRQAVNAAEADWNDIRYLATIDTPRWMIPRIIDAFRGQVARVLTEDPYKLLQIDGLGFSQVDALALQAGMERDDPKRHRAIARHTLEQLERNGHTYSALEHTGSNVGGLSLEEIETALEQSEDVVHEEDRYYLRNTHEAERYIASRLK